MKLPKIKPEVLQDPFVQLLVKQIRQVQELKKTRPPIYVNDDNYSQFDRWFGKEAKVFDTIAQLLEGVDHETTR